MTGRPQADTATPSNTGSANGGASAQFELRWPEREGAVAYRVVGRDTEHDRIALDTGSLEEAHYRLSDEQVPAGRPLRLRIDVRYGDGEWTPYGPAFLVPAIGADEDVCWLRWPDDGAGLYRVLVTDYARHETVVDEIVLGTRFPLRRALLRPASEIRWRARPWRTDHWDDAEARALPFEVLTSEPAPAVLRKAEDPGLLLLFTVDTEGGLHQMRHPDPARTIDQLVFGDHGGGESLGIGLQMDLLEQFGFRGTFFVDVLLEYTFGRDALERTVAAIADRGHEVELHVHDEHLARSDDPNEQELAGALRLNTSPDHIRRVLDRSVSLFTERVGRPPRAFRAGAYHVGDTLLALLPEFGIHFDTSLNRYRHAKVSDWMRTRTQPFRVGELLELPVSWQARPDRNGQLGKRLYAPNRTPGDALTAAPAPAEGDPLTAVYVSHSFSLMRKTPAGADEIRHWREAAAKLDRQFADRLAKMPDDRLVFYEPLPDDEMVAHARSALERVAVREDASCVTFEELEAIATARWRARDRPVDPVFIIQDSGVRARLAGTRIYSEGLLDHLGADRRQTTPEPSEPVSALLAPVPMSWSGRMVLVAGPGREHAIAWLEGQLAVTVDGGEVPRAGRDEYDAIVWLEGFDRLDAFGQAEALARCLERLAPEGLCVLGARTLGLGDSDPGLPFAAELLFPSATLARHRGEDGPGRGPPWDVATFASLIREAGFDVLDVRRHLRSDEELELLARHRDKLRWLDDDELSCAGVLFVAQRPISPGVATGQGDDAAWETVPDRWQPLLTDRRVIQCPVDARGPLELVRNAGEGSADVLTLGGGLAGCRPGEVPGLFAAAYRALVPGGDLLIRLGRTPVSETAAILCAMQAGLEVVETEREQGAVEARLTRPFEPEELDAL